MMPNNFEISVDGDRELIAKFTTMQNLPDSEELNQALLDATMPVERHAKENLTEMVYSLEPSPSYPIRTNFLFDKTMGARSGSGENPYFEKVERIGNALVVTVASLVHYAKYVHFGTGRGRNSFPRPFLTKALQESKEEILEILKKIKL